MVQCISVLASVSRLSQVYHAQGCAWSTLSSLHVSSSMQMLSRYRPEDFISPQNRMALSTMSFVKCIHAVVPSHKHNFLTDKYLNGLNEKNKNFCQTQYSFDSVHTGSENVYRCLRESPSEEKTKKAFQ